MKRTSPLYIASLTLAAALGSGMATRAQSTRPADAEPTRIIIEAEDMKGVAQKPGKVWSCFHRDGVSFTYGNGVLTLTLPTLGSADVVVIAQQ